MPSSARCTNSARGGQRQRKEKQFNTITTPTRSAPSATGRQYIDLAEGLSVPEGRAKSEQAPIRPPPLRGGPLHRSAHKRPFLLDRAQPVFFSGKTEKGPPLRPARWGEKAQGSGRSFRRRRKRSLADFATTTMGGASRWTSPLREQTPPWPPFGGPYLSQGPPVR